MTGQQTAVDQYIESWRPYVEGPHPVLAGLRDFAASLSLHEWMAIYIVLWSLPIVFAFLRGHRSKWAILMLTILAPPGLGVLYMSLNNYRATLRRSWFTMLRWSLSSGLVNY